LLYDGNNSVLAQLKQGVMNNSLHISDAGLAIEKKYSQGPDGGFAKKVYYRPGGDLIIGYGHVIVSSGDYMRTAEIDEATACALLARDNAVAESAVKRGVTVKLCQCEFDALTAFAFHIGGKKFAASTVLKKLNSGDKLGAANGFLAWGKYQAQNTSALHGTSEWASRCTEVRALFLGASYA
jgi:lysozyme